MGKTASDLGSESGARIPSVEAILKDELTRGDRALRSVPPVLSHMLASSGQSLVSDAIVARLRGMLASLSTQLLAAKDPARKAEADNAELDLLSDRLASDSVVLSYCYAMAMEGHLAEKFEQRSSIDPILSPLLQELIASDNAATAELAMNTLAAQSRFVQSQRRMDLPLAELPAELFHAILKRWEAHDRHDPAMAPAVKSLKAKYDEGASRIGLLARLVTAMRGGAIAALQLDHAGFALFASALSALGKQPRELAVLACHEHQAARLALSLRAAGLGSSAIKAQFELLHPAERLPSEIEAIAPERASILLNNSNARDAG
ncbi:hypothetical protein [Erythrobacter rubeus]|uniref:DUF2336 domain-containing protein n=1 Tax=Erythrobacter rubeus TaxID=2760803 RepID=A0ABR8KQP4_9SPHN|nr:hypothetical protein [Erythrobacter rubeus]MBD2841717.1 hypothetical protein [Erythrobacter rubeus]